MCETVSDFRDSCENMNSILNHICCGTEDVFHDVVFVFGPHSDDNQPKILAHKLILSLRSHVFASKFAQDAANVNNDDFIGGKHLIRLPSTDPEAFRILLKWIYTDKIEIEPGKMVICLVELILLAERFQLKPLYVQCLEMLYIFLKNTDNALKVLEYCVQRRNEPIAKCAEEAIFANPKEAINNTAFIDLSNESLYRLLASDELAVEELQLFQRVVTWAENKCNRRGLEITPDNLYDILRENYLLYLIRFTLMPLKDFQEKVVTTKILSSKSANAIQLFHFKKDLGEDLDEIARAIGLKYLFKKRKSIPENCDNNGNSGHGESVAATAVDAEAVSQSAIWSKEAVKQTEMPSKPEDIDGNSSTAKNEDENQGIQCEVCDKTFSKSYYRKHKYTCAKKTEGGKQQKKCLNCKKCFSTQYDLEMHYRTHQKKVFKCFHCHKRYVVYPAFKKHILLHRKQRKQSW